MNVFTKALAAACAVVVVCVSGRGRVPAAAQSALPTGFVDDVVLRGASQEVCFEEGVRTLLVKRVRCSRFVRESPGGRAYRLRRVS